MSSSNRAPATGLAISLSLLTMIHTTTSVERNLCYILCCRCFNCSTLIAHNMSTPPDAKFLARISLHDPTHFDVQQSQTIHRLVLLQHWNIPTGSNILELGCGQGDCTTVLAHAVGERGRVVAVDPAELDYGVSLNYFALWLPVPAV
jgi:hypothetical protein